jgi:hypothetical protein
MRNRADHKPGGSRLARWLGFDRNPLRRKTDRVEAVLRLILVILLVAGVPAAAVAAGRWADHQALHWAQAQRAAKHQVTATLLRDSPLVGSPNPYSSVQGNWVPARWQRPGQPSRTGVVFAVAGARKGSTVRIWTDPAGAITDPPLGRRDVVGDVMVAVMTACLVSWLALLAAWALARRALDRRRLSAWEAEWRASGPLWTGRRG